MSTKTKSKNGYRRKTPVNTDRKRNSNKRSKNNLAKRAEGIVQKTIHEKFSKKLVIAKSPQDAAQKIKDRSGERLDVGAITTAIENLTHRGVIKRDGIFFFLMT